MPTKISQLTSVTSLDGTESIPLVQTTTKRTLLSLVADYIIKTAFSFIQSGTGAVIETLQSRFRRKLYVTDFLTEAQRADVAAYTYSLDVTSGVQAAMNAAWAQNKDLECPGGGYLVTGLTLPGNYPTADERYKSFRMYGQGYGNPYSNTNTGGTVFKSVTNAAIITDRSVTAPNAHGTYIIDGIRFDGTSTAPVVQFYGFYGESRLTNCVVYQRGTGDGVKILYGAGGLIENVFAQNSQFATTGLGASRTGVGFNFPNAADGGLVTYRKCSARGWLTGYSTSGGAGIAYNAKWIDCEASTVYNGFILGTNARGSSVTDCYLEGGDGGIGIQNLGNYNVIKHNHLFSGFAKGIEDTSTSNVGSVIESNAVSLGAVANSIGIDVQSSAAFGGYQKTVIDNTIVYTAGTNGVNGIKISGTDPRINLVGNGFDPRSAWTGTSTYKINDTSSNGVYGLTQKAVTSYEIPFLSRGAISLFDANATLTQSDVVANVLTITDAGSYYICSATGAATVQKIEAGVTSGRLVIFRTTTANMTFQNTAYIKLAGAASFTGPGTLVFIIERVGGSNYAYELDRTVF